MELVVINGASAASKTVLYNFVKKVQVSKLKILDYHPYRSSLYDFQRLIKSDVKTIEKH